MDKELLIKKWLNHDLTEAEWKAFKLLDDYEELIKLDNSISRFKTPSFDKDGVWSTIRDELKPRKVKQASWIATLSKLAAVLVVGLGILYFSGLADTSYSTESSEMIVFSLPDDSKVQLNANSKVEHQRLGWTSNREVHLDGEAFFKVTRGSTFKVLTEAGEVTVLGTEFNVIHRQGLFEVICYEGSVSVSMPSDTQVLKPGQGVRLLNNKLSDLISYNEEPSWLNNESSFDSLPLHMVLSELDRQFDITINSEGVDTNQIFTGSFSHQDLSLALKTVLTPFNISYRRVNNEIVLSSE